MSDADIQQTTSPEDRLFAARSERPLRFLGLLTLLALTIGLLSLLSYSLAAPELMRSNNPALGAWWEAHQFDFMVGGATGLGLLLGIHLTGSLVAGNGQRSRAERIALLLALIAFAPLLQACAEAARLGFNGRGAAVASWLVSREGYAFGQQVDKVMIAGIYFLKNAGFALLAGLGLTALSSAVAVALEPDDAQPGKSATSPGSDHV